MEAFWLDLGKAVLIGGPLALLWNDTRIIRKGLSDRPTWAQLREWCEDCKGEHEKVCKLRLQLTGAKIKLEEER